MWRYFQPNPENRTVGDCSVRAVAKALGINWDEAFDLIVSEARSLADMPSSDAVWGAVLRRNGYSKAVLSNACPDCFTAQEFLQDHPTGTYVLGFGGHVATARDGVLYDAWDSSRQIPIYYWYRR